MRRPNANDHGFTLIEVIVTIIVSAILAVLLMQVMSGHITRSYWALEKTDQALALHEVMETININYRRLLTESPMPLVELQNEIETGTYWSGRPYGADIQVDRNHCIGLDQDGESGGHICEHPADTPFADTLLKVTISYREQSLTTLFSR